VKFKRYLNNKTAVLISSLFFLHVVGLFYTADFEYALNDLRIKLPLLVLPIILSSTDVLTRERFTFLMHFFVLAVWVGTVCSIAELIGVLKHFRALFDLPQIDITDGRHISIFISHIRFSLMICLAVFYLAFHYFLRPGTVPIRQKSMAFAVIAWLVLFLFILESVTGIVVLVAVTSALLVRAALKQSEPKNKFIGLAMVLTVTTLFCVVFYNILMNPYKTNTVSFDQLEKFTARGNVYLHDTTSTELFENGNYVWIYICRDELQEEWNKRSELEFTGIDKNEQMLEYTLIRFLTSRGLRKDAEGVLALTDDEVSAIEKGIANVNYTGYFNPMARLNAVIWELNEYRKGGNASGHSVSQRFEFWKAAIGVMAQNPVIGVGTGDVQTHMQEQYESMGSQLSQKFRKRPHNQFISLAVAFGILGLIWFGITLVYPIIWNPNKIDKIYFCFLTIALLSMIGEDTLETQAGVSFFAFFNSLLLFVRSGNTS